MKNKMIFFFLAIIFIFLHLSVISAETIVSECGTLDVADETYILNQSLSISGDTCLTLSNKNITLDCNGFNITGNNAASKYGISANGSSSNLTIKNCDIISFNRGISITSSSNNNLSNLKVLSGNSYPLYISSSHNNTLSNITISSTLTGYGLILSSSTNNNISHLDISATNAFSLYIVSSHNNNFSNINTSSTSGTGIYLSSSNYNNFSNINTSSTSGTGISLYSSNFNEFLNIVSNSNTGDAFNIYTSHSNTYRNINSSSTTKEDIIFSANSDSHCVGNVFENFNLSNGSLFYYANSPVLESVSNKFFEGSTIILCNADYSNITNATFSKGGIQISVTDNSTFSDINIDSYGKIGFRNSYSSSNKFFNLNLTSTTAYSIYITGSHYNNFSNINASSTTEATVYFGSSTNNNFDNLNLSSVGNYALQISSNSNNFSNINAYSSTSRGISISTSDYNNFSNIDAKSGNNVAFYIGGSADYNDFSNINASSGSFGILLSSSTNNNFSNINATSDSDYAIYLSSSTNNSFTNSNSTNIRLKSSSNFNNFTNIEIDSKDLYGIYIFSSNYNNFLDLNVSSNSTSSIVYITDSDSNNFKKVKISSLNQLTSLLNLTSTSDSNIFCLNNFTETSGRYIFDENGANFYNCTYESKNQGNIYPEVVNGTVDIKGTLISSINELYSGSGGSNYPYNETTSLGKVVGIIDYAPLTPFALDIIAPIIILNYPENNSNFSANIINFTISVIDDLQTTTNCSLYINNNFYFLNESILNNTLTNLSVSSIPEGNNYWNVSCNDGYNSNWSEIRRFIVDISPPTISEAIYNPSSNDSIDPQTNITFNVTLSDSIAGVSSGILEYYNGSDWENFTLLGIESTDSYYAIIETSSKETDYTFRIWANDTFGNSNASNNQTFFSYWDCTWTSTLSLGATAGYNQNKFMGNITINNTGDILYSNNNCSLDFRLTHNLDEGKIYYDGEYIKNLQAASLSAGTSKNISINASFETTIRQENLIITLDEFRTRSSTSSRNTTATLITTQDGPYLYMAIDNYPTSIYLTSTNFTLESYLRNLMGDVTVNESRTAYNVSFNWEVPSDFSLLSGSVDNSFDNITNNSVISNDITLEYGDLASMTPGIKTFILFSEGYNLSGGLIHDVDGNLNLTESISISFLCYNESDGLCVEACGYSQDPDCNIPPQPLSYPTLLVAEAEVEG